MTYSNSSCLRSFLSHAGSYAVNIADGNAIKKLSDKLREKPEFDDRGTHKFSENCGSPISGDWLCIRLCLKLTFSIYIQKREHRVTGYAA